MIDERFDVQVAQNAVRLLVSLGADGGASRFEIWRQIDQDLLALDQRPLLAVTNEEVAIWQFPEGKLYDTSVIERHDTFFKISYMIK